MIKVVYDTELKKVSEVNLPERIFGAQVKDYLLYDVVKMGLASRRRGTASTKPRARVRGGGRKPWRQKGTGRARAGCIRSPLFRGGGIVFGPRLRDYSYSLPKKVRKAALRSALSLKARENKLLVVENLFLPEIKTKGFLQILNQLKVENALIVDEENPNLEKSARNVPKIKVLKPQGINVYDILRYENLILTQRGLKRIEEGLP